MTSVSILNRTNDEDITSKYNVNNKLGILTLVEELESNINIEIEYQYFEFKKSRPESFWENENIIKGFCINKNSFMLTHLLKPKVKIMRATEITET